MKTEKKSKLRTVAQSEELLSQLKGLVRLLVLLAFFKLAVVSGVVIITSQQSDTIEKQTTQLEAQGKQIDNINTIVERVTSDEANRAQQIILYKIFLAQCEGRFVTNQRLFEEQTGDKSVEECAKRLFLAQPQLPADAFVVPTNENTNK